MTAQPRLAHPATVPGRARRYWMTGHLLKLGMSVATLAAVAYAVSRPTDLGGTLGWLLLAPLALLPVSQWATRRLRWQAWTEVPGAWRTYTSRKEADACEPPSTPDRWAALVHHGVLAGGGVLIADLPGNVPAVMIGFAGAGTLVLLAANISRGVARRHFELDRAFALDAVAIPSVPVIAWLSAGDSRWWPYGFALGLALVLFVSVSRLVCLSTRGTPTTAAPA